MPLYEIQCERCGYSGEVLTMNSSSAVLCPNCGVSDIKKLMSATSSLTGHSLRAYPGPKDKACCGTVPSEAGCAGPGSCCGKVR